MPVRQYLIPTSLFAMLFIGACAPGNTASERPIVLGDPATIVTETDTQYLQDFTVDMKPVAKQEAATDTIPAAPSADIAPVEKQADNPEKVAVKEEPLAEAPKGDGLAIVFKDISVFIPDIKTRSYNKKDIRNAADVSYQLTGGTLNGKQIKVSGGTVQRVSQRTQTVAVAKSNLGTLLLESLSATSGWATLKGDKNTYSISGLTASQLVAPKATPAAIRNAVTKAARSKRLKKTDEQKWLTSVKNVRSTNQKPLQVSLRTVTWKIEGKDAAGKNYQKQIRMDIPIL